MNYYLKIFLYALGVGFVELLIYFFLLQFQIVHSSGYVPQELVGIVLILLAIPLQFLILLLVGYIFKRKPNALYITCVAFFCICFTTILLSSKEERALYNNEQVYNRTEKYDYSQGISTPEGYPIKLLTDSKFTLSVIGDRTSGVLLETGKVYSMIWGAGDNTTSISNGGVVIPDSLKLYWYSFVEDKYYGLKTKLDKDKISQNFKTTYKWDINGDMKGLIDSKYSELVAGIAPGGNVVLWISSSHKARELGIYKAKEMDAKSLKDYDVVSSSERQKVLTDTCTCENDLQNRRIVHNIKPIPFGLWTEKYRKKYNWKIDINQVGQTRSSIEMLFFNGERDLFYNDAITNMKSQMQALPVYIYFVFIKGDVKYKAFLSFDEDEIYNNFDKLSKTNPAEPLSFDIAITTDFQKVEVKLKSKDQSVTFQKIESLKISSKKIKNE
ncbi:DUF2931 family protein [Soonwooa sp.]|uniref:DUF2931 family protein n=1 Tax=Soonwooa sp. TaxID=1938592 RepID=UPI00262993B1|nr:DUF2931 family protein [Soonwooa sp.]